MKEGTKTIDRVNVFHTLMFQLTSMGEKIDLVNSIILIITETLDYGTIVKVSLSEEVWWNSNIETSTPEAMMARG